jgi:predicted Zn finger-like uncharacterized protein
MILSCNSCEKKFVVPDQAIIAKGRTVQCGSCGNKWKQFPLKKEIDEISSDSKKVDIKETIKIPKKSKPKKKKVEKKREINLYSPEYLMKKHGISISETKVNSNLNPNEKVSYGFYNTLFLTIIIIIVLTKGLYFAKDFIILELPFTKFYLNNFFESIRNVFEIWKNLISNY